MLDALQIINILEENNFEAYLVGGSVRDIFLGIPCKDMDIVTNASPSKIQEIFFDYEVNTYGKSFKVCVVEGFEVSTYRKDTYYGYSDKNCKIESAESLEKDLERRDLTINSIAYSPTKNKYVDPFNGKEDIKNRIIRFTGNPENRIYEDKNRIIRACRFLAKINGQFDYDTFMALKKYSYLIKYISPERIRIEILKALDIQQASLFFSALSSIDGLKYVFPYLDKCVFHDGGNYHSENIFEHCMLTGDCISPKYKLIKLAGYLHDIGKPKVYDRLTRTFYGHDGVGSLLAQDDLIKLRFSNYEIDFISNLIEVHMININNLNKKSIRKILNKLDNKYINFHDFLRLKIADRNGSIRKNKYELNLIKDILKKKKEIEEQNSAFKIKDLKINGFEIMKIKNLTPGPEIGLILEKLLEIVIDNPELNNKEKLTQIVKEDNFNA